MTGVFVQRAQLFGLVGLVLAVLATAPFVLGPGALLLGVEILTVIAMAQAWNLLAGYGGLVSLGHHGFVGIGSYALFVLTRDLPLNPYAAVLLAGIVAALAAVLMAPLLFRLRDAYFAVGLWAMAEICHILVLRSDNLGGVMGLPLYAARNLDRTWIAPASFWLASGVALSMTLSVVFLSRGRFGLRLRALRDDPLAARSIGVGVRRVHLLVFAVSAAGAGMAGAVHSISVLFLTPQAAFDIRWTVIVVFVTVIGGLGRISGPLWGAMIYFGLREILAEAPGWHAVAMGIVAVIVMILARGGIAHLLERTWAKLSNK